MAKTSGRRLVSVLSSCLTVGAAALGCGGADVRVAFDHQAGVTTSGAQALTLDDGHTPSVFGMKLVTIYVVEDRDANSDSVGNVGRIWTNPVCDPDGRACSILPEAGRYQVQDYFDLARPSAEVNAALNAQGSTITAGTYRYLHMDLAGPMHTDDRAAPNLRFGDAQGSHDVRLMTNGYWVVLDPPMVVADGDAVTVTLGYDLAGSYFADETMDAFHPPAGTPLDQWYCGDNSRTPAHGPCLRFAGFVPAVSNQGK